MHRCDSARVAVLALCTAVGLAAAGSASAQLPRQFPQQALRGEIEFVQPPDVRVGRKPARLAPGARIRDVNNMTVVSGAFAGQRATVNYTLDPNGQILDVWVLTPGETARKPWPATPEQAAAWRFDWAAQTWSRP